MLLYKKGNHLTSNLKDTKPEELWTEEAERPDVDLHSTPEEPQGEKKPFAEN